MDHAKVILRLKKTILYTEKALDNYPKKEYILRNRISDTFFSILENSFYLYSLKDKKEQINGIKKILSEIRLLDFYLQIALDKMLVSRKKLKNICLNLRDITSMYYGWITYIEKKI